MIEIRREQAGDQEAVHNLNLQAFNGGPEAGLIDRLRDTCADYLAFVATEYDTVVGHILFTPVVIEGAEVSGMGLAPMSVAPAMQNRGIGGMLIRHALAFLRERDCPFVVVLGHPQYYPRFGFENAANYRLRSQWEGVPDEAFMIKVFDPDRLPDAGGVASYRKEFDEAM